MRTIPIKKLILVIALICSNSVLSDSTNPQDIVCLAKNIYYESRGESRRGKLAVAQVTLNRVKNSKFPNSVCKVVYQKHQFSWTKTKPGTPRKGADWNESVELATLMLRGDEVLDNFPATHFHQKTAKPKWRKHLKKWGSIGNHVFYV